MNNYSEKIQEILKEMNKIVIGQDEIIKKILIGIFIDGHILLEGLPGLAKSLTVNSLAKIFNVGFSRIQFTPDLLPSDIIGMEIYEEETKEFKVKKGPIFSNFILADEINRAPAKVQSALLEAMQERQITIGDTTFRLDNPFIVLATQNPIEQNGTYPLPEAQQDRFLFKLKIDYPKKEVERELIERISKGNIPEKVEVNILITQNDIETIKKEIEKVFISDVLKDYIIDIIFKTREKNNYIECGASPRATINILKAAKANAYISGRDYVSLEDIREVAYDILRHRIILSYEAEVDNITVENVVADILNSVEIK
ncbi:MoxR-like ATPase [Hypnocyclicus thermotrophus]|uniref:MoxR-like ATPase n=1 Tax=Hypnocyclicus thermotrophus TaxID=1627895 RepID=A0AA46DZH5_9FUSO|nr:MoxR family ATPase [Hypnocyclicus thermotrophus]TDT71843.1 MoxR-like ATPase [Hypnocyclicus thermotrophus]